jgi:hypothetical protein
MRNQRECNLVAVASLQQYTTSALLDFVGRWRVLFAELVHLSHNGVECFVDVLWELGRCFHKGDLEFSSESLALFECDFTIALHVTLVAKDDQWKVFRIFDTPHMVVKVADFVE